ncbi:MAG: NAD(P)/FAD-dependent oxidoreductase [Parvularcula sp.]
MDFDSVIVGAGCVGLATGFALSQTGRRVLVLEAEDTIGQGISSRNSEVIHGGLYYPTGSLKAELCVAGRRQLYDFLDSHHVAYRKCGKLVVANGPEEEARLDGILQQAEVNGVEGMVALGRRQAQSLEPHLRCTGALLSPQSGVMDSHGYMAALEGRITEAEGHVVCQTPFEAASPLDAGGFSIRTGGVEPGEFTARELIIAAGLGAQKCAAAIAAYPKEDIPQLYFGKGVYFALSGKAPFEHLIYPPPIPGALGTHYRKDLGGQARFGPDLAFVDEEEYSVDPNRAPLFYETIRRFWPDLPDGALVPDYAGIRPKLHGPGQAHPDWRIDGPDRHGISGLITLFGIESPGLTASLAIGKRVAEHLNTFR